MEEKLSVRELAKYYVDRYSLPTQYHSNSADNMDDGLGPYVQKLTRILKGTKLDEVSLWEVIKHRGESRKISVALFERQCFPEWHKYITEYCDSYNKGALLADRERQELYQDERHWDKQAKNMIEAQNRALENGYMPLEENLEPVVLDEDVKAVGRDMMLEALYNVFFEPFQWEKLKKDMQCAVILSGSEYNAEIDGKTVKAMQSLQSYLNYVGRRKNLT